MQASFDDLTINLAQIWSNRVISLPVADLGAALAISLSFANWLIDRDRSDDCHLHDS
jgi:hypothetical protein